MMQCSCSRSCFSLASSDGQASSASGASLSELSVPLELPSQDSAISVTCTVPLVLRLTFVWLVMASRSICCSWPLECPRSSGQNRSESPGSSPRSGLQPSGLQGTARDSAGFVDLETCLAMCLLTIGLAADSDDRPRVERSRRGPGELARLLMKGRIPTLPRVRDGGASRDSESRSLSWLAVLERKVLVSKRHVPTKCGREVFVALSL